MAMKKEDEEPSDQTIMSESQGTTDSTNAANERDDEDDDDDLKRAKAAALEASKGGGHMTSSSSDEHQKALLEKHTSSSGASHRNLFFHTTEKLVKGAPTPIQDLHKNWMKQHDQMNQNLTNQLNKFGIKLPGQGHGHTHGHATANDSTTNDEQPSQQQATSAAIADDASKSIANEATTVATSTTTTTTADSNQMDDTTVVDKSSNAAAPQGKTSPTTGQPPQISTDKKASTGEGGDVNETEVDNDSLIHNEDGDDTAEGASSSSAVGGTTTRRSVVGGGGKLRLSNPLGLKKPAAAVVPSNVKKALTSIGRKKSFHTSSSSTVDEEDGEGDDAEPASQETTTTTTVSGITADATPVVEASTTNTTAKAETITGEGSTSSPAEPTSASVFRPPTTTDVKGTVAAATGATTTTSKNVAENDKKGSPEMKPLTNNKKKDVAVVSASAVVDSATETKEATNARNAIAALASFDDTTPKASPSSSAELVPTNQVTTKTQHSQQLRSASTPNIIKSPQPQQQQQRLGGGSEPVSSLHASYSSNVTSPTIINTNSVSAPVSAVVPSLPASDLSSSTTNSSSLIRSTIVWKRRDGFGGKFANLALLKQSPLWERRKLVLEDSKLSYFVLSENDKLGDWATQAALRAEAEAAAKSPAAGAAGGGIQDIVHWWQETTAHATADVMSAVTGGAVSGGAEPTTGATTTTTPSTPTTSSSVNNANATTTTATGIAGPEGPRGTIDLLKENASIMTSTCSNYGVGGGVVGSAGSATAAVVGAGNTAPTPFCLTIKIHDQHAAKWKLCFDSHQQQLEWLVLLSNRSTIQSSIEEFVVDQSKSIVGGARMTCTLDPNTGLYVVKNRDSFMGSPTTTPTATTKKEAKKASDANIPPPPPPIDTAAPPDNSHDDPTMTSPRMTPTKSTTSGSRSIVQRGQAAVLPKGTLSLRELTNHNTELPFLLLPSIWKRHYMYHTYVKPWFQISLKKKATSKKKSKKSSSSPKHNVYYPYQPPITLYLIGDRLDLMLWICNICIMTSYVYAEEWSLMKFVGFIALFNLMASLCCCQLEDYKLMGYATHDEAAAFADRVAQRTSDEIQPRTPKSPARRGVWGFGKQRRSANSQQSPHQQQSSGGDLSTSGDSATDVTMEEATAQDEVAMVTEEEEEEGESESEEEEEPGEERRRKIAFDGIAGSTTIKFSSDISTPTKAPDNPQCLIGWRPLASKEIMLRDTGYATTKQKVPSPHSLYECVAVDVFQSSERIPNFVTKVKQLNRFLPSEHSTNQFASPDLFVLTIALPCDAPKLGKPVDDGNGTTIVAYFRMTQETRQVLEFLNRIKKEAIVSTQKQSNNNTISAEHVTAIAKTLPVNIEHVEALMNGVKLFETWCDLSYHKKDATFQSRFKFLPQAVNSEEFGMPSYMAKYNGKPVLIKRAGVTGTLSSYPSLRCMEFDMNLHAFPYLAKQAFAYMKDAFCPYIVGNMACCIEGRSDAELPECLLGGFQIWYPDPTYTPTIQQFFAASTNQEEDNETIHHNKPPNN